MEKTRMSGISHTLVDNGDGSVTVQEFYEPDRDHPARERVLSGLMRVTFTLKHRSRSRAWQLGRPHYWLATVEQPYTDGRVHITRLTDGRGIGQHQAHIPFWQEITGRRNHYTGRQMLGYTSGIVSDSLDYALTWFCGLPEQRFPNHPEHTARRMRKVVA